MRGPRSARARLPGAALRLLQNLGGALRDLALAPFELRVPREWVAVRLDHGLLEAPAPPSWLGLRRDPPRTLSGVLDCLERAGADPAVRGVLLRVGHGRLGWAQVEALARALGSVREAGKRCVVYAEATGNAGAWLGAAAGQLWMAPAGRLDLVGVRVESPFLKPLLERLGVRPEVMQRGRYKSAGEVFTEEGWTAPAREALEAVVDDFYSALVEGLAAGRGVDVERARRWVDEGPYRAAEAHEAGLVDALVYGDAVPARLAALEREGAAGGSEPDGEEAHVVGDLAYLRLRRQRFRWRSLLEPTAEIAIVPLLGVVRGRMATPRGTVGTLRRLARSERVRAVVLRIDSPGGDALGSDLIWRAVRKLGEVKPVVASLATTAASGGYYVAMAAQEIVAEATTLTGSIGVVLASVDVSQLLDRIGVRVEAIERGSHAGIYDATRPRTEEDRALFRRQLDHLYDDFVQKAAEGRGLPVPQLDEVAQGRVWTGQRACAHGLVDHLGGLETALARARALAGLGEDEGEPVAVPSFAHPLTRLLRSDPIEVSSPPGDGVLLWCPIRVPLR